jgi:hypothetical protein
VDRTHGQDMVGRNRQELWIGGAGMITRRPPQRR